MARPNRPSAPPRTVMPEAMRAFWRVFTASLKSPTTGNWLGVVGAVVVPAAVVVVVVVVVAVVVAVVVVALPSTMPRAIAVVISTMPVAVSPRLV